MGASLALAGPDPNLPLHELLAEARALRGLTQEQVGARVPAHADTVGHWESERVDQVPSVQHIRALAPILRVPVALLLAKRLEAKQEQRARLDDRRRRLRGIDEHGPAIAIAVALGVVIHADGIADVVQHLLGLGVAT